MALKKPSNVVLDQAEAHAIIVWLYGSTSVAAKDFTKEDCGFAQAMLVEMLDASFAMGFVEALFRSSMKPSASVGKVITGFLKGSGKNLVKFKDRGDLEKMIKEPVIYKAVQSTMALKAKSVWKIREATDDLSY